MFCISEVNKTRTRGGEIDRIEEARGKVYHDIRMNLFFTGIKKISPHNRISTKNKNVLHGIEIKYKSKVNCSQEYK